MTWLEYEYAVNAYFTRNARHWEPTRELQTMLYNMFAEKGDKLSARELIWLYTDEVTDQELLENETRESEDEFFARMKANNFYQSPTTPSDEKNMSE